MHVQGGAQLQYVIENIVQHNTRARLHNFAPVCDRATTPRAPMLRENILSHVNDPPLWLFRRGEWTFTAKQFPIG